MSYFINTKGNPTLGIGVCDRCRKKFPLHELIKDRDNPGLRVCRKDADDWDPYRDAPRSPDKISVAKIRPDVDIAVPRNEVVSIGEE